ncbi:MAG: T9SS type A sorting domain-containing protein [Flavobacteriales bacterium]|nr:T9SS type A sorting domain-containing protein [Flavobacteriales bacterium]
MKKILLTLGVGAFLSAAVAQDITSNLEAYVSFDGGDAIIDAGNAQYAGIINGATPADDRNGNANSAMYLDGNDWIDFGNYADYQFGYDSFTITCWMKGHLSGSSAGYVIGKRGFTNGVDRVYALTYNYTNGGQAFGYFRDNNGLATTYPTANVLANEWHHVAMVVDRSNGAIGFYIDGAFVSGELLSGGFMGLDANGTSYGNLVMGRSSNGDQYFKGWIDEVRIYRRALTALDLTLLADPPTIDLTSNLKIDLPFCDGQVVDETTLHDMSTQFDGTYATTDRNGTTDAARAFSTGSQSYVQLPHDLIASTDFTIALWYYYVESPLTEYPRLVDLSKQLNSNNDAIILYASVSGANVPYLSMWNASGIQQVSMYAGGTTSINEWTHLVVTKVGSLYSIYMNGQLTSSASNPFVPANVNRIVSKLGKSAYTSEPELFLGSIDDFKVWQRGLTADEVDALYNETDPCVPVVPCDVYIPDAVFKQALVNNSTINTNQDTEIQCSEAAAYSGYIGLNSLAITDLTGLEAFTSLTQLDIGYTSVPSFDITANTALTYFDCSGIGFSGATLTFDAANAALQTVFAESNQLAGLDVSALPNLYYLKCGYNNTLANLDLSQNPALEILAVDNNFLTDLDLSNNPLLTDLSCTYNAIVALDLSANSNLLTIGVSNNALTYLNVANGNNTNVTFYNSFNNPNLGCIQVDDVAYSNANWTNVSSWSTFNTYCTPPITVGIDEQEPTTLNIYPNPTKSELFFSEAIAGEVLDITGKTLIQFPMTRTLDLSQLADGVYLIRTASGTVNRIVKN